MAPTFHSGGQGWGTRMSTVNNSYNQVGNFAAADEGLCRSLVFGGVPMRFPNLHFAFHELAIKPKTNKPSVQNEITFLLYQY